MFKVSTQPFSYHSRKRLSTPPLTGNNLHIYGHAVSGARRRHGESLFRAGRGSTRREEDETLQLSNNQLVFWVPSVSSPHVSPLASCDPTAKQF